MAWTAPSTWVAGAILTAAQLNTQLRDNLLAGGPIYATEALRDAAITSPFEGQRAYITGSTVAAATGSVTAVPTGIQTIYNGTAWVCVTSVGASSNTTGTTTSGSYVTTLTGDGTAISATLSTGTTALITLSANATSASVIAIRQTFSVSGATTVAAADNNGSTVSIPNAGNAIQLNRTLIITGLTAGTNTFTMNYQSVGGSNTASFSQRSMFVQGIA
jgi:hypothetical protein